METTTEVGLPEQHHEPDMVLTPEAQYYLQNAGKWASFLAIMGFIGCGLLIILSLFFIVVAFSRATQIRALLGVFMGSVYLGVAFLVFLINYRLYQFALNIQRGIAFLHHDMITRAVQKLHAYLRIKGIMLIVVIVLYLVMFIMLIMTKGRMISSVYSGPTI